MIAKDLVTRSSFQLPFNGTSILLIILGMLFSTLALAGNQSDPTLFRQRLESLIKQHHAQVGISITNSDGSNISVNGDQRFPMQSVMKLLVAAATLEAVDSGRLHLDDQIVIRKPDLSLAIQPLADLVIQHGEFRTTIDDLIRRAIVDSDSAATDILIQRLGGPSGVQAFLQRHQIEGIRIDRDERHLQTEISGISWRPEYVDAALLDNALDVLPATRREAAFQVYLKDERDTATPNGMGSFLYKLATGKLL
jgi:beta-lactamase class A